MRTEDTRGILIVEDNRHIREMITLFLGHAVPERPLYICTRAAEALALCAAQDHHWAAAIIDYSLPDGDGVELIREMNRRWPSIQSMLYTGDVTAEVARAASQAGAAAVLHKPLGPFDIWAVLQPLLASARRLIPTC